MAKKITVDCDNDVFFLGWCPTQPGLLTCVIPDKFLIFCNLSGDHLACVNLSYNKSYFKVYDV